MILIDNHNNAHEGAPRPILGLHVPKTSVLMLHTKPGSEDGIHVHTYKAGRAYTMAEQLAAIFIDQNWAVQVLEPMREPELPAATIEHVTATSVFGSAAPYGSMSAIEVVVPAESAPVEIVAPEAIGDPEPEVSGADEPQLARVSTVWVQQQQERGKPGKQRR